MIGGLTCNDAFHVKTSQTAKNKLNPAKNKNQPKMLYTPFLHESIQLFTSLSIIDKLVNIVFVDKI